jgi:transcriptional regulator with XRE-family HTH domain/predicted HTH domain antitoxin
MSIGERIHQARKMAGKSLRELAPEVGVSVAAISKYERGEDVPSSGVLLRLAKALEVRVEYFLRPRREIAITPAFRKRASLSKKAQDATVACIRDWLERYMEIEEIARADGAAFAMPETFPRAVRTMDDVERAADDLRAAWVVGDDPIRSVTELLEDEGIKVGAIDAPETFDACTFWADDGLHLPVIAVRRGIAGDRQRLSLAHELGHLVLRTEGMDDEKAAMRFAGAFLVPERVARRELGASPVRHHISLPELISLRTKYGMSVQAWVYRARGLGILSEHGFIAMQKAFRRSGTHNRELGDDCLVEEPRRRDRLVLRAFAESAISEMKAAELMSLSLAEFARLRNEMVHGVTHPLCD